VRAVHYRAAGKTAAREMPTACAGGIYSTTDTDVVTCPACRRTELFTLSALRHCEVVEALAYPKEDHPCLSTHQP
jgi:hypothetical protein